MRSYNKLIAKDNKLAAQVESVYETIKETMNSISGCYNNYTMHDMNHGLRVASYMEDLAFGIGEEFERNIEKYNAFELALLILSAILHDIGMFIRPEDKESIKNGNIKYTNSLTFSGVLKVVNYDEEEAIKEIVRVTHPQRIKEYMSYDFGGKTIDNILQLDDKYPYSDDIIDICISHGETYDYLKHLRCDKTKGSYFYNPQFIAVLLRIADLLDLDKQRTPILWYKMMRIDGFSRDEWEKHFIVHNEVKIKKYLDNKNQVFFEGVSSNAKIHRKYLKYIDELKIELENADELLNTKDANERYKLKVSTKIDDCVTTKGFKYSDLRLNLDYFSITNLLMGKNIYGDSRLGLRELIQNSIDACKLMKEIQNSGFDCPVEPQIFIIYSAKKNYVKIKDTGIGMTLDVVKKHFLNVGKSYYESNEYLYENYSYKPIGHYGIGFLACFLLSNNVTVITKNYNSNEINQIELEKDSEYVVTNIKETGTFFGTEIVLDYNQFFSVFKNREDLIEFLEKYFLTDIPIKIKNDDEDNSFFELHNCCERTISVLLEKENLLSKVDLIRCCDYSSVLEGIIHISKTRKKRDFCVTQVPSDTYFYNNKEKKFQIVSGNIEKEGYYRKLQYLAINDEIYKTILRTKKTNRNKRNEMIATADRIIYLLIHEEEDLDIEEFTGDNYQFTINNISLQDIFTNSGFEYYPEMLDEFEYFASVFVSSNKYINIQRCVFESFMYPFHPDLYKTEFFFYNKDILINDFRGIVCGIPAAFHPYGFINYLGNDIKLDVSRNTIIEGHLKLRNEITLLLLKYLKNNTKDEQFIEMIEKMIEYNSKY